MNFIKQRRRTISRLGLGFSSFLLTGYLLQIVSAALIDKLSDLNIYVNQSVRSLMGSMSMYLVGTLICWLIIKDMPVFRKPWRKRFTARHLLIAVIVGFSVLYIGNLIGLWVMGGINGILGRTTSNPVGELVEQMNPWAVFLQTVVAAPIFEELLFRKLLIDRVQQYGDVTAILLSATLFGFSHGNFYQFFYAFALGVLFAYVYINTNKLRYTIVFHGIINFMGSIVSMFFGRSPVFLMAYLMFLLFAIVLSIVLMVAYHRKLHFRPALVRLPFEVCVSTFLLNGGLILFFGISGAMFLLTSFV